MITKNNYLNIRCSSAFNWQGQSGSSKGFCEFESVEMCRRAGAYLLLRSYRKAGCYSIERIISRWAPMSENPTAEYIRFVAKMANVGPIESLYSYEQYASILAAMEIFEQGIVGAHRFAHFASAKVNYLEIFSKFNIKIA